MQRFRRVPSFGISIVLAFVVTFVIFGAQAQAIFSNPPVITLYDTLEADAAPFGMAEGPDGNVWFTQRDIDKIGRITPDGAITDFDIVGGDHPFDIFAGPDNHMWFTLLGSEKVGKISMSGTVTLYDLPTGISAQKGTAGPDGNLWFTASTGNDYILKVTPSGTVTQYDADTGGFLLVDITSGPGGKLWYSGDADANALFNITTDGVTDNITITTGNVSPMDLDTDSEGNLWFKEYSTQSIGRMTPDEVFTTYPVPSNPYLTYGMNRGPDGRVWFTDPANEKVDVVDFDGTVTAYDVPSDCGVSGVSAGGDGNIWFTCQSSSQIGKLAPPAPSALNNSATVNAGETSVVVDVLRDVTNSPDPSTLTIVSGPSHGTASVNTTLGTISYTAAASYSGTDSLTYSVCSIDNNQVCTQVVLTISVTAGALLADTGMSQTAFLYTALFLGMVGALLLIGCYTNNLIHRDPTN